MNLSKNGKLLCDLRKAKGLTQKQVADKLGIVPKTVSKWETGHGFPDVSTILALADILGVSEKTILSGDLEQNLESANNMKRTKFYVCPHCGSFLQGTGNGQVVCCGKQLEALTAVSADDEHTINVSEIEDDYYIEFNHEMTKEHYISFIVALGSDKMQMIKLYPEGNAEARVKINGVRKLLFYCNRDGLFSVDVRKGR